MYQDRFRYSRDILGRDAFIDLLSEFHMMVRITVRKPRTTDSTHGLPTYPNLAYDFVPVRVNQLWVSDITYITIWKGDGTYSFCYLSLILDAYSKEIVGWSLGESLRTTYPLNALEMALRRLPEDTDGLIHHSDRGVQYASSEYVRRLTARGIRISMTENGDPKENAQAERINNTMKNELLIGMTFYSPEEARAAILKAVDFYNNVRPHMSLDMMTPVQTARMKGPIKKLWYSYREQAIQNEIEKVNAPSSLITENCLPLATSVDCAGAVNRT